MKRRLKILGLMILCTLIICACKRKMHEARPALYFWRSGYVLSRAERQAISSLGVTRQYLRCFDVDWNDATLKASPVAIIRLPEHMDNSLEYIPVAFITQNAISSIRPEDLPQLSANIAKLLKGLCANSGIIPKEIQIDCDWTAASRDVYFSLLNTLRKEDFFSGRLLSCTIRLHQLKYKLRSGIPPADRGMLMLYNIGNLKQANAQNSILDAPLAKEYLGHLAGYSLPLDVALPLFSWCVLFRRGIFTGIIRDARPTELNDAAFTKGKGNIYTVNKDTVWHDYGLRAGDVIRAESPSVKDLKDVAAFSAARLKGNVRSIAFFGADSIALSHYSKDDLKEILDAYR